MTLSDTACSVALVVPGLCGPSLDSPTDDYLVERPRSLEKLLSRALTEDYVAADTETVICGFFDVSANNTDVIPVAALTMLADTGQAPEGFVMRADPVHLRADQACLRLFDSSTFAIDAGEAAALVEAFNSFYRERGWHLEAPVPQRWYLGMNEAPGIATVPPLRIAGQDINQSLPQGRDSRAWHALLNEFQMLFHNHPVNAAREERGDPVINSIWPWGGGRLPQRVSTSITQVIADQPLPGGLARLAGIPWQGLPAAGADLPVAGRSGCNLVVLDALEKPSRYGDAESWVAGVRHLEQNWFTPLLEMLARGRIACLDICPVNGKRHTVTRRRLQQFWKRRRTLAGCCHRG